MAVQAHHDGLIEVAINHRRCSNARYGAYLRGLLHGGQAREHGFCTRVRLPADAAIKVGLATSLEVAAAQVKARLEVACANS